MENSGNGKLPAKEYLDLINKEFDEKRKRVRREQESYGIVEKINGGLSLRLGEDWNPPKKKVEPSLS